MSLGPKNGGAQVERFYIYEEAASRALNNGRDVHVSQHLLNAFLFVAILVHAVLKRHVAKNAVKPLFSIRQGCKNHMVHTHLPEPACGHETSDVSKKESRYWTLPFREVPV